MRLAFYVWRRVTEMSLSCSVLAVTWNVNGVVVDQLQVLSLGLVSLLSVHFSKTNLGFVQNIAAARARHCRARVNIVCFRFFIQSPLLLTAIDRLQEIVELSVSNVTRSTATTYKHKAQRTAGIRFWRLLFVVYFHRCVFRCVQVALESVYDVDDARKRLVGDGDDSDDVDDVDDHGGDAGRRRGGRGGVGDDDRVPLVCASQARLGERCRNESIFFRLS